MSNKVSAFIFLSIALFVNAIENKETIIDQRENDQNGKSNQDVTQNIKHYESKNFEDGFIDVQKETIALRNKSIEWQKRIDEWTMKHAENLGNTSETYASLMHHAAEAMREELNKWLGKVEQWKKSVLKAIGVRNVQKEEEEERKETQREIAFLEHETLDGGNNGYEIKELE